MKKENLKVSNGVKYYEIDGENGKEKVYVDEFNEYVFYPFTDAPMDTQNRIIAYLKETQPDLFKDEYFFYEVFLPNYRAKMFVVSDKRNMYLDIDDASLPILFETKKYWVICAIKDFFYNNVDKVKDKTYYKSHDIVQDIEDWMEKSGLKDEYNEVTEQDAYLPFDIMSRLPW